MRVGVPKEIKIHEFRVGLTPGAVREYIARGRGFGGDQRRGGHRRR
jgi:alanine dehydrogenase